MRFAMTNCSRSGEFKFLEAQVAEVYQTGLINFDSKFNFGGHLTRSKSAAVTRPRGEIKRREVHSFAETMRSYIYTRCDEQYIIL